MDPKELVMPRCWPSSYPIPEDAVGGPFTQEQLRELRDRLQAARGDMRVLPNGFEMYPTPEAISVLNLKPGDVLVVRVPGSLSLEAKHSICERMATAFPDNKCVVIDGGATLDVVRPEAILFGDGSPTPQGVIHAHAEVTDQPHISEG